jgi:rubredoxin
MQLEDDFLEMIDDDISCRVCGRDDQEDLLLICDECGNGYHTYCLELPGVPAAPEWMCPLCEVDQLSADEDLYDDSDMDELQHILFDDTLNTTDTEVR